MKIRQYSYSSIFTASYLVLIAEQRSCGGFSCSIGLFFLHFSWQVKFKTSTIIAQSSMYEIFLLLIISTYVACVWLITVGIYAVPCSRLYATLRVVRYSDMLSSAQQAAYGRRLCIAPLLTNILLVEHEIGYLNSLCI